MAARKDRKRFAQPAPYHHRAQPRLYVQGLISIIEGTLAAVLIALAAGIGIGIVLARKGNREAAEQTQTQSTGVSEARRVGNATAFERLVRSLPLGILMLDRSVRVVVANESAATIFEFDAERASGLHLIEAIPNIELERRVEEALAGEASLGPLIVPSRLGNRTYALSAYPVTARNEREITGALVIASDQTEFVALDRARQEFLSNVSHELRTPLSSIKLMLETVLASPEEEAADLFLPQVLAQVDRLTALVGQLLEQARAQAGQLTLDFREIDLEGIVTPIVASFEPQAAAKGVELQLQTLRPVRLEADPDRLAQVFVNLIDNALRYTHEGGTIRIRIDADGADALIRIRDTGIGIPYKSLPHIFERFYVVDRSRTRLTSGVGLGLSIVKQIVDAHGGTISAESTLGRGTTFTLRIPILHLRNS